MADGTTAKRNNKAKTDVATARSTTLLSVDVPSSTILASQIVESGTGLTLVTMDRSVSQKMGLSLILA